MRCARSASACWVAVTCASHTACQLGSRTRWPRRSVQLPSRRVSSSASVRNARASSSSCASLSARTASSATPRSSNASAVLAALSSASRRAASCSPVGSCPSTGSGPSAAARSSGGTSRAMSASTANSAGSRGGGVSTGTGSGTRFRAGACLRSHSPTSLADAVSPSSSNVAASRSAASRNRSAASVSSASARSSSADSRCTQRASAAWSSVAARSDSSRAAICSCTSWSAERPRMARHNGWISSGSPARSTRSGSSFCASTSTRLPCATRWQMRLRMVCVLPVPGGPCTATLRCTASRRAMDSCASLVGIGISSRCAVSGQPSSSPSTSLLGSLARMLASPPTCPSTVDSWSRMSARNRRTIRCRGRTNRTPVSTTCGPAIAGAPGSRSTGSKPRRRNARWAKSRRSVASHGSTSTWPLALPRSSRSPTRRLSRSASASGCSRGGPCGTTLTVVASGSYSIATGVAISGYRTVSPPSFAARIAWPHTSSTREMSTSNRYRRS